MWRRGQREPHLRGACSASGRGSRWRTAHSWSFSPSNPRGAARFQPYYDTTSSVGAPIVWLPDRSTPPAPWVAKSCTRPNLAAQLEATTQRRLGRTNRPDIGEKRRHPPADASHERTNITDLELTGQAPSKQMRCCFLFLAMFP